MVFSNSLFLFRALHTVSAKRVWPQYSKRLPKLQFAKASRCCVHTEAQTESSDRNITENNRDYITKDDRDYALEDEEDGVTESNELSMEIFQANRDQIDLTKLGNSPDEFFTVLDKMIKPARALDVCTEDLSYIGPYKTPTATFAKYANESLTIKKLVKLGVNLAVVEKIKGAVPAILSLDYNKHVAPCVHFLETAGVPMDQMGGVITRNPYIFFQDIRNLELRLKYLQAHNFTDEMIQKILLTHPAWISYDLKGIDRRLSYFQKKFKLKGNQVRHLAVECPKLITHNLKHIEQSTVIITDNMGFDQQQMKRILLKIPDLWMRPAGALTDTFDYVHEEMGLSHEQIVDNAYMLYMRKRKCEARHKFLAELKKAQYDPTKPRYVSPVEVVTGTDEEFCRDIAKCAITLYNKYLKTL